MSMNLDRMKDVLKGLKTERVSAPESAESDEWIANHKVDVTADGSADQVFLVVFVGTGRFLGRTRIALFSEGIDGSVDQRPELSSINELKLYYAIGKLKTKRKEETRVPQPPPERRPQPVPPKRQHPQAHAQHAPAPRPRIQLPDSLNGPKKPAQVPVERVVETMSDRERHLVEAITSAGLEAPPKALHEMLAEEVFSHLSRQVGGPVIYKGRELDVEEAGKLDPEDLYEALVESRAAARS